MAMPDITLNPDQVSDDMLPSWLRTFADYIKQAAASGKTITIASEERLLTPEQVAQRMGVHRSTISRRIKDGELKATKIGGRNKITYAEFRRYQDTVLDNMVMVVGPDLEEELFGDT
ncbi:MAG: helix-turn-helix domain-containing protein [Cellulomonadaceae bacterium]|jgi:excisionase family DNA binding protein|nr:helix-turn-helix domain-containing protein [Cellulomonadaceae bacterium]